MKTLLFNITLNNHTFNIQTNHRTTLCFYSFNDKYTATLIFASNTLANVKYKNIKFSGTVTKRNNWSISLDDYDIVRKHYNNYFPPTNQQREEKNKLLDNNTTDYQENDYSENILYLYNQLINDLSEQYFCIDNKEEFKFQLCEYLSDSYALEDIENLDKIVEYENYENIGPDEEPIIEKHTVRNLLLNDCEKFFVSFSQSEKDFKNKSSIITLENIVKEVPEIHKIPYEFLSKEFDSYLDDNYDDLIVPSIYHCLSDKLHNIGISLYKSYQCFVFINSMKDKIDKILSAINVDVINKDEIYSHFEKEYDKECFPNDKEFKQNVMDFINDYVEFNHLYDKFFSLFGSNHIDMEWDDRTIQLFKEYDKNELLIDAEHSAEYEVYKYVVPYYKMHFFKKNSNKYKPIIQQFPAFVSYASSTIDILFKHNILIDNGEKVIYNEDGDINFAIEEIAKISAL